MYYYNNYYNYASRRVVDLLAMFAYYSTFIIVKRWQLLHFEPRPYKVC